MVTRTATKFGNRRWTISASIGMLAAFALLAPGVARAQDDSVIVVQFDEVVETEPGVITEIITGEAPGDLVGRDCTVEARGENNSSEHPNTNLLVTSNGATVVLEDVEAVAGKVTTASARLTLGETFSISVEMGPDGIFSGSAAASVIFDCNPVEVAPTSSQPAPTTTAVKVLPKVEVIPEVEVLPQVQVAPPAQPTPEAPAFTG